MCGCVQCLDQISSNRKEGREREVNEPLLRVTQADLLDKCTRRDSISREKAEET